jgi:hypothetical protein
MKLMQNEFVPRNNFVISATTGFTLSTESKKLSKYYSQSPPFLSLIEENSANAKGVYSQSHNNWQSLNLNIFQYLYQKLFVKRDLREVSFIKNKTLWIQLIHQDNLDNFFYAGFPVFNSIDLKEFKLDYMSTGSSFKDILRYFHRRNFFFLLKFLKHPFT